MSDQPRSAATIWQTAYGELQLQMPRETFDTWLRQARLIAHEDGTYIIGVHNVYAREWLEHRLKKVIVRTLGQIAERTVEVSFVVWSGEHAEEDLRSAGPLLASLEPTAEPAPRFEGPSQGETGLNPRYTFEAYAVGSCNRLAHAAAMAVIETPATQFNPLYIYADVGLGKTHLLHAIGNSCREKQLRVLFVASETFTNDLVGAIKSHRTPEFREKYRNVDLLLVDDIDFLAGKESSQEEFYHTFNTLYDSGAQVVVVSSRPPGHIKKLDPRLQSRFDGGLVVELMPPDFETRMAILHIKAQQRGAENRIPLEAFEMIAGEVDGSVRDLEGALNRLIAASMLTNVPPSTALVEEVLGPIRASQPDLTLEDIIMAVAEYYRVDAEDLCGRGRSREVSIARQVAVYLAYKETNTSLQQIGEAIGGRNHSTVLYSYERIGDLMDTDSQVRRDVQAIMQTLKPQRVAPVRLHHM
ncbi:MAG: chromosomal replication initiator protein DnaA [Anaerolineae bacterium]|nr:chromosomal replication initiator protein DnaA [Anaerolineae bacterium]